ncbi:MAG: acetylgalactosaminidase, partial [Bacteroidota bacterium]|nr:acetylgalactosaminidase [Bacteroidota bacterium]
MSTNRRDFLRNSILGTGMLATGLASQAASLTSETSAEGRRKSSKQKFNMCGYAAPKLDKVRVGFVGIGDRGSGAVERMTYIEGVEITALCDIRQAAVDGAQEILSKAGLP